MENDRSRLRRAELLSTTGAVVLGLGLGLLLARWISAFALPLLAAGIAAHAWGMFARRRVESAGTVRRAWWEDALYWLCWLAMAAALGYAFLP